MSESNNVEVLGPEVEVKAEVETEAEVEVKAEVETDIEPEVEGKADIEPEVEVKADTQPEVEAQPKIDPEVEAQPLIEFQTQIINSEGPPLRIVEETRSLFVEDEEEAPQPPTTDFGFGNPDKKGMTQLLKYYLTHPTEKPPQSMKRLVQLFRLHKEYKARREAGYESDESSDLFYASDESVEYSSDIYEGIEEDTREKDMKGKEKDESPPPQMNLGSGGVSSSRVGIRAPNCFIRDQCLRGVEMGVLEDNILRLYLRKCHCSVNIPLPTDFDGNDFLKALEEWVIEHS